MPKYRMLLRQSKAELLYKASLRQPLNIRQVSSLSYRSSKLLKKLVVVKSVKPTVLKSRQARIGCLKRLAKGLKGINTSVKQGIRGIDSINALLL